jgi:hypothetical protein
MIFKRVLNFALYSLGNNLPKHDYCGTFVSLMQIIIKIIGVGNLVGRKLKFILSLLFLCLLLTACGQLEVGDTFTLKGDITGGDNINSMQEFSEQIKELDELGYDITSDPDPDNEEIPKDIMLLDKADYVHDFDEGDEVEVIEISDKHNKIRLKNTDPDTGDVLKIWVDRDELNKAK